MSEGEQRSGRELERMAVEGGTEELRAYFAESHPADIAELMNKVDHEAAAALFTALEAELRAEVLPELDDSLRDHILSGLDSSELAPMIGEMESDDAADVVQELKELDEEAAQDVLEHLEDDLRADVVSLLEYPEDTAGGVMAREYVAVLHGLCVDAAIREVRRLVTEREVEDIYAVYVVDERGRLEGYISLQGILLADRDRTVDEIMDRDVVSVPAALDQEELAATARKYDLASIPVVDDEGVLLGRVTMDDVYDITDEEAAEDLAHLAGTEEEVLETSSLVIARERLPWLMVGLAGGILSALLMSLFEADLRLVLQASFFIPVVMGMGGNVGIQSSTIVVRGLATGELAVDDLWRRSWKETKVSLLVGLVCSTLMLTTVWLWMNEPRNALVIAGALASVIVQASVIGASVPLVLRRMGVDPAIATGPFITTSNDILGLGVYLLLVSKLMV